MCDSAPVSGLWSEYGELAGDVASDVSAAVGSEA